LFSSQWLLEKQAGKLKWLKAEIWVQIRVFFFFLSLFCGKILQLSEFVFRKCKIRTNLFVILRDLFRLFSK
jgi:hypothetical protein